MLAPRSILATCLLAAAAAGACGGGEAQRAPLRLMRLRGGSWLFTPKIVPVTNGDGGVVQWRQPANMPFEGT